MRRKNAAKMRRELGAKRNKESDELERDMSREAKDASFEYSRNGRGEGFHLFHVCPHPQLLRIYRKSIIIKDR